MRTFYALLVHRKDGGWRHRIMRGEVPNVGDTIPATLADEKVRAKVSAVKDPARNLLREPGRRRRRKGQQRGNSSRTFRMRRGHNGEWRAKLLR
jgi:hypothetical protein